MNTKWTSWVGVGTVLAVLSSQVMAQPWGGGAGRGRGFGPGQGRGMGWTADRPGPGREGLGQGGPGAWCPFGADRRGQGLGRGQGMGFGWRADRPGPGQGIGRGGWQRGPGAWGPFEAGQRGRGLQAAPGWGQAGLGPVLARRLNLTDDQVRKIRDIVDQGRVKTMAAIKEVLTDEQRQQFERIREKVAPQGRRMRESARPEDRRRPAKDRAEGVSPADRGPASAQPGDAPDTGFQRGQGRGAGMGPRGQGPAGPPFGAGRGRGVNRPDAAPQPPANVRGPDGAPGWNRGVPPIEQMFEQADTDKDGALTREELRAFHRDRAAGPGPQRE